MRNNSKLETPVSKNYFCLFSMNRINTVKEFMEDPLSYVFFQIDHEENIQIIIHNIYNISSIYLKRVCCILNRSNTKNV